MPNSALFLRLFLALVVLVVLYKSVDAEVADPTRICIPPAPEDDDYFKDLEQGDADIRAAINRSLDRETTLKVETDRAVNELMFEANPVKQLCSHVPCNQWTPYVYRCVPSCKRSFYMWIACPTGHHSFPYKYIRIEKRLPQCCELLVASSCFAQEDQCDPNDGDCFREPFAGVMTAEDDHCPVEKMQATLDKDPEIKAEVEAAKLAISHLTKPPVSPVDLGIPLCYKKYSILKVPPKIWIKKGYCYFHWYYVKSQITYVNCGHKQRCSNLPCSMLWSPSFCYPANFLSLKLYMFCPHLKPKYWYPYYVRLPQCCECRRTYSWWLKAP
ncbi:unnamed protein product [Mytilus edulis]|uniref:Uncharacterized protein n=1 Tax=Mytilus edulis TaxID=6550 RepID=A0A8S3PXW7_MYTED|nr:unnamed protein product [Mytilus edulis]